MGVVTTIIMDVVIIVLHFTADTKEQRTNLQRRNVSQESYSLFSCGNHRSVKRAIEKTS